jgi:hypothetical protein
MRIPWFQFTLRQHSTLIVALAIVFALFRAPFGPLLLATVITLTGFAIDRARGGSGFRGGILACVLVHLGVGVVQLVNRQFIFADPSVQGLAGILLGLSYYVFVGSILGIAVSVPTWMIVSVNQPWRGPEPETDESFGSIDSSGFEDSVRPDPWTGGSRS